MSVTDLKNELKVEEKIIFGSDRTVKELLLGNIKKVFLTNDCSEKTKEVIENYSKLNNTEMVVLDKTKDELREIIKKPFVTSIISVVK